MSYMDTHAAFAPAGGIQVLSFDEIEEVGGGLAPLAVVAVKLVIRLGVVTLVVKCKK